MKRLKKNDFYLAAAVLVLAGAVFFLTLLLRKDGKRVTVSENGAVVYSGELSRDKKISLSHNTVRIKDGQAYMEDSDCRNRICINSGKISRSGETVVCLPNRVIIEIE